MVVDKYSESNAGRYRKGFDCLTEGELPTGGGDVFRRPRRFAKSWIKWYSKILFRIHEKQKFVTMSNSIREASLISNERIYTKISLPWDTKLWCLDVTILLPNHGTHGKKVEKYDIRWLRDYWSYCLDWASGIGPRGLSLGDWSLGLGPWVLDLGF